MMLLILMFSKDFSLRTIRNLLSLNLDHQSALSKRKRDICQTHHYQDYNNNEMDAVIGMPDGVFVVPINMYF